MGLGLRVTSIQGWPERPWGPNFTYNYVFLVPRHIFLLPEGCFFESILFGADYFDRIRRTIRSYSVKFRSYSVKSILFGQVSILFGRLNKITYQTILFRSYSVKKRSYLAIMLATTLTFDVIRRPRGAMHVFLVFCRPLAHLQPKN